jgi:hypothetical protein
MKLKGLVEMFKSREIDGIIVMDEDEADQRRRWRDGRPTGCSYVAVSCVVIWTLFIGLIFHSCTARADSGVQVYLEDEQDLGNGWKLCIYSEGVTITKPDYELCPISIRL